MIPNFWILTVKIGTCLLPSLKGENYFLLHLWAIQSDSPKSGFSVKAYFAKNGILGTVSHSQHTSAYFWNI